MHVGDGIVGEDPTAGVGKLRAVDDVAGVVADPVIAAISAHDCRVEVVEPRRQRSLFVSRALRRVQKDRSRLGIRLKVGERPKDDALREQYLQLGRAVVKGLYARAGKDDLELARVIQERLKE